MPMSSDAFDLAWSVAKSEGDDFDIEEHFLHRKGILDFIESRGRDMKERYLRELGILPPLEQPLTEQPVVAVPDVRGEAGEEGGTQTSMGGRQMDEGPKDSRQEPKSKVREAKEETPEIQPEDKVEPATPKEEVGMPQPPKGKPPKIEDIAAKTKDVTSKPPRGGDLTMREKIQAIIDAVAEDYEKDMPEGVTMDNRYFNPSLLRAVLSGKKGEKLSNLGRSLGLPNLYSTSPAKMYSEDLPDDMMREYLLMSIEQFDPEGPMGSAGGDTLKDGYINPRSQGYYERLFERLGLDPERVSDFVKEGDPAKGKYHAMDQDTRMKTFLENNPRADLNKYPNVQRWLEEQKQGDNKKSQKGTSKKVVSDVPPSTEKPKTKKSGKKPTTPPAKKKDDFKIPKFINQDTNRDVLERIVDMAEDGNEEAYKTLLNNSGDLEDHFPDIHERYEELRSVRKSFILKDPFANPFHNPNFLDTIDIRREMAQPMSPIIKSQPTQEQVKPDIGFDTVEGDDLSLLPASIFMGRDNSVGMDDMSLLPTGWRNE